MFVREREHSKKHHLRRGRCDTYIINNSANSRQVLILTEILWKPVSLRSFWGSFVEEMANHDWS